MISFEQIQIWLIDITSMFQLFGAILGLCALLIPILRTLPFYYTLLYWYDMCMTMIIHTFSRLGKYIPYFGSSRYIDDLQYQEDPFHICLSSSSYKDQQHKKQQQSQKVLIDDDGDDILVSGLINTGNTCFLNSVLQALSSLPGLYEFIYQMKNQQHELPITWTLFKTLRQLTKPQRSRTSIRPLELVRALANKNKSSTPSTYTSKRRLSSFLMDRDQQDAQEFFQVLIGAMDTEAQHFYQEKWKSSHEKIKEINETDKENGLRGILLLMDQEKNNNNNNHEKNTCPSSTTAMKNKKKRQQQYSYNSPMTGLLASRLSCVQCGYTGAIRHFPFNNIQLSLPNAYSVTIEQCLEQYTNMEYLRDASCKRCSFNMTSQLLDDKIKRLQHQAKHTLKKDLKKKLVTELVEISKYKMDIDQRLKLNQMDSSDEEEDEDENEEEDENENEEEEEEDNINEKRNVTTTLKNRKSNQHKKYYYRTISPRSTKQVMIAKPPPILCLHMTRSSINYSSGMIFKNTCQLLFNEYLNLSPFVTNGILNTHPTVPLSGFTEGNNQQQNNIKYLYRLMSIVVHYGSHSYGHYIAYKRKILPSQCQCYSCHQHEYQRQEKKQDNDSEKEEEEIITEEPWYRYSTWYRISDSKVDICNIEDVLASNPYMLIYERVNTTDDHLSNYLLQQKQYHQPGYLNRLNNMDMDDDDDDDDEYDDDDNTSTSEYQQSVSPPTPFDDDQEDNDDNHHHQHDYSSTYYNDLTGTSLEALQMANSLLSMDQHDTPSTSNL
ncbi:unnamed protein product [Cunninghamella echinulata]